MERQLINYLPSVMRDILEFQELFKAQQVNCEDLWNGIEAILKDSFVYDATENGVKRWESILKILPKDTDDLEVRKFRIIAKMNEEMPYTYAKLIKQLTTLCGEEGYTLNLNDETYTLCVRVALDVKQKVDEVEALLERIVPCHLIIDVSLMYNQHKQLSKYTYRQLGAYTHKQLREEVM